MCLYQIISIRLINGPTQKECMQCRMWLELPGKNAFDVGCHRSNSLAIEKTQPSHHLSSAAGHMGDRDVKDSDRGK